MKRLLSFFCAVLCLIIFCACSSVNKKDILREYNETDTALLEEYIADGKDIITIPFYEMKDDTFIAQDTEYSQMFRISGRLNNAAMDSGYIILSNIGEISFEQAWKASGLSSNSEDYFDENDLVFVGFYFP